MTKYLSYKHTHSHTHTHVRSLAYKQKTKSLQITSWIGTSAYHCKCDKIRIFCPPDCSWSAGNFLLRTPSVMGYLEVSQLSADRVTKADRVRVEQGVVSLPVLSAPDVAGIMRLDCIIVLSWEICPELEVAPGERACTEIEEHEAELLFMASSIRLIMSASHAYHSLINIEIHSFKYDPKIDR